MNDNKINQVLRLIDIIYVMFFISIIFVHNIKFRAIAFIIVGISLGVESRIRRKYNKGIVQMKLVKLLTGSEEHRL